MAAPGNRTSKGNMINNMGVTFVWKRAVCLDTLRMLFRLINNLEHLSPEEDEGEGGGQGE